MIHINFHLIYSLFLGHVLCMFTFNEEIYIEGMRTQRKGGMPMNFSLGAQ